MKIQTLRVVFRTIFKVRTDFRGEKILGSLGRLCRGERNKPKRFKDLSTPLNEYIEAVYEWFDCIYLSNLIQIWEVR